MKRTFLPILAAFALIVAASASYAQTASAVGSWTITIEAPNGKRSVNLIIKQEGHKLTGLMRSERGDRPLESVTVKGNEITLVQKIQAQGQELVVTYKGTVEKDSMKGDADFGGFAQGTWSAVPFKEGATAPSTPAPQTGAAAGNISGVWNFTVETSAGTGSPVFTLKQEGEQVTGTYKGQFGEGPINGTVKGGDVKIVVKVNAQGQDLEIIYTGKVESANSMKGKVQLGGLGEGNWSAKKQ